MEKIRAEIVDTGIELFYKTQLEIKAPAKVIFDLIADPKNHQKIDPLKTPGEIDLTAHVDFGALDKIAKNLGTNS